MCLICQLPTTHEAERILIANYVDPTSGYVVQSIIPMVLGFFSAVFAWIMFFFRKHFHSWFSKKTIFTIILLVLVGIIGIYMFQLFADARKTTPEKKVIVLGFDGMDPKLLEKGIKDGALPHFKKLAASGSFTPLATALPPQSPVAWASFATGNNPQKHGVYDFIVRNPKTYELELTFSNKEQIRSKTFWEYATEQNIPLTVLFLPDTFPAQQMLGKMVTGMGTPDLTGTQGTAHLVSSKPYEKEQLKTKVITVENKDEFTVALPGPRVQKFSKIEPVTVQIGIQRDEDKKTVTIVVGDKKYTVGEKKFSSWIPVTYTIDFLTKQKGMIQVYIKEVAPDIELYISPVVMDPRDPIKQLSYPKDFSKKLVEKYGVFSTLGLPHDTIAFDDGIFDDKAFLAQAEQITKEREKIYFGELKEFTGGIFVGYFGFTDTISHMFWRYEEDEDAANDEIMKWYKRADAIVGRTMRMMGKDDTMLVMSDHGFSSYDYEMNLNSWLRDTGYLTLKNGKEVGNVLLEDIDWSKTKAYAIGYNGIYINRKGREGKGIVAAKDVQKLEKEIAQKLSEVKNPLAKESPVIKKIYTSSSLGIAATDTNAPDIFVGFYAGTRPSFDAAIGSVEKDIIKPRTSKWSGDHLFDPSEVPGILVMNKKVNKKSPELIDIMPTVFSLVSKTEDFHTDGKSLLEK